MPAYEPEVNVGDARDLSGIPSGGVDLICAHPLVKIVTLETFIRLANQGKL